MAQAEAAIGYLNAVGIRLQAEVVDSTSALVRVQDGKYEWYIRYAGPGGNWTRYRNPAVDHLLDRAAAARDNQTMLHLVQDAERRIVDDAPWAFILYLRGVMVKQPYVRGLRPISIDMDWQPLEEVWLAWFPKRR